MPKAALLMLTLAAACMAMAVPAFAAGPSGSTECHVADDDCDGVIDDDPAQDPAGDAADDPGENQVTCNAAGSQNAGGVVYIYVGANGAEGCADETSSLPIDGRAAATTDQGGYATIDGDNTNPAPANGYVRVDPTGVHCGNPTNQDSGAADQSANTAADCG
jgi:hypothetical protein